MKGYTDQPVEKPKEDVFGVTPYIEGMSEFILHCSTPMTIAIQGDWGSGKTSMMNLIRAKIEGQMVCTHWFNTWQYSQFNQQSELPLILLTHLLVSLKVDDNHIKQILGFAFKLATATVGAMNPALGAAVDIAHEAVNDLSDRATQISELKANFSKAIQAKLSQSHCDRLVVFIDDLDRLQPERAVEVLEVLKVFLDCPNCVFVLAIDYEVVTQGIKAKFGALVGEQKGRSFFDKIIQLPFKVPVVQYNLQNYVATLLQPLGIDPKSPDINLFIDLIRTSIGSNPRTIKRLVNSFLLLDGIYRRQTKENTLHPDRQRVLFALLCMQMAYENLYFYLAGQAAHLDSALLQRLTDPEQISADPELQEALGLGVAAGKATRQIAGFAAMFLAALQLDEAEEISEDEIANLKSLLSLTALTAVASEVGSSSSTATEAEWESRRRNRRIVKSSNDQLSRQYPEIVFSVYQANRTSVDTWFSDATGYTRWRLLPEPTIAFFFDYLVRFDPRAQTTILRLIVRADKPGDQKRLEHSMPPLSGGGALNLLPRQNLLFAQTGLTSGPPDEAKTAECAVQAVAAVIQQLLGFAQPLR